MTALTNKENLPPVGAMIALTFEDCCVTGKVIGRVTETEWDDEGWPLGVVKFEDGSVIAGADGWERIDE